MVRSILTALTLVFLLGPVPTRGEDTMVKNFPLVNQDGKPFQLHDLMGKYVMVTFIFTRCPLAKMCPLTMTLSKQLLRKWKANQELKIYPPMHILAVTMDPDVDKPAVLKKFGRSHGVDFSRFTLATGDPQVLTEMQSEFNVLAIPQNGMISHNMKNILLGPNLKVIQQFRDNEWKPDDVIKIVLGATTPEAKKALESPQSAPVKAPGQ